MAVCLSCPYFTAYNNYSTLLEEVQYMYIFIYKNIKENNIYQFNIF